MSADTPPQVEAELDRLFAMRSGNERLQMVADMFEMARDLAIADILARAPGLTRREVRLQLLERFYQDDLSPTDLQYFLRRFVEIAGQT